MFFGQQSIPFKAEKDIPSLAGKVILVTGGNAGLGKQCVLEYAKHNPREIWIASRNTQKARATADEIAQKVPNVCLKCLELDLGSFDSVKKAAATFNEESDRLNILMLNAGVMAVPPTLTKSGYEIEFGTNHMGHALFTKLLLPTLLNTSSSGGEVRIVSMTSSASKQAPKINYTMVKTPAEGLGGFGRYSQSKLANVLWARQLAKAYPQFTVASIHPGLVQTDLMDQAADAPAILRGLRGFAKLLASSVEQGARNQLWGSVSKDVKSGEYYEPVGIGGKQSENGKDEVEAEKLWNWTEKELQSYVN
ncbi:hypothetical protein ACHAPJ_010705 [Fusarium lateritium]